MENRKQLINRNVLRKVIKMEKIKKAHLNIKANTNTEIKKKNQLIINQQTLQIKNRKMPMKRIKKIMIFLKAGKVILAKSLLIKINNNNPVIKNQIKVIKAKTIVTMNNNKERQKRPNQIRQKKAIIFH